MNRKFYDSSDFTWHDKVHRFEKRIARMIYNQAVNVQQDKNGNPLQIGDAFIQTLYPQSSRAYVVANFVSDHIVADNGELFHWSNVIKVSGMDNQP